MLVSPIPSVQLPQSKHYSSDTGIDVVSIDEVKRLIGGKDKEKYVLIDVREPNEVAEGRIPTAQHVPVGQIADALQLSPESFQSQYGFCKPSKDDNLIVYCRSGKRSTVAHTIARQLGYRNAKNYVGSWLEWSAQ